VSELSTPTVREVAPAPSAARLSVRRLSKTFGASRVLRDVAIDVRAGEIHGLIGQNGSGKSTLAKILTGLYTPDPGTEVAVDGAPLRLPVRPDESRGRGVAVVHQTLGLVDGATVLENMRVGRLRGSRFLRRIDWRAERREAEEVFARLGRTVPLDADVAALREEERATVAIARALQDVHPGQGLIIFDESTRALGRRSLEHFFEILGEIVATGTAALLITHRLEEIVDAADRVTILRDGAVVEGGREVAGLAERDLAALMLGRTVGDLESRTPPTLDPAAAPVRVTGLSGLAVRDLAFDVAPGEVVGLTGLSGSGYDDVPYLLTGVTRADAGTVALPEGPLALDTLTPADAIEAGVVLVPEGREHAGLAMSMSVAENTAFPRTSRSRSPLRPIDQGAEKQLVAFWTEQLDVRPRAPQTLVKNLSGGNQQKVLLAKWLASAPTLLVLHEPTQAVDVGARHTIVEAVRKAAREHGCAVVVAGSDENELTLLCDRVLVFADGAVRGELRDDITPDGIVQAIYTNGSRAKLRRRPGSIEAADTKEKAG